MDVHTCSGDWADPGLPAWGTAARASFWVGLEQPGPWGAQAATQSRLLDPEVGAALEQWCLDRGGRLLLLRAPGGEGDPNKLVRRVFVAGNLAGDPWLGTTTITGPASLIGLLADAAIDTATTRPGGFDRHPAILTICTNARRDQCCAVGGLPLAKGLFDEHPGQIWECSHLSGHRFAPTGLLWPTGQVLGRLDTRAATEGLRLAERGLVWGAGPTHDRGRTHLEPARQAAEAYVRAQLPPKSASALTSAFGDVPDRVLVRQADGQEWLVSATHEPTAGDRRESCGKAPIPTLVWRIAAV